MLLCAAECRFVIGAIRRQEPAAAAAPMPWWIIIAAVPSVLLPTIDTLQRGQVALALTWPLLLGLRLALDAQGLMRACLAGVVLALPIAIKLTPLVPVAVLVLVGLRGGYASQMTRARWQYELALTAGVGAGLILFLLVIPAAPPAGAAMSATWKHGRDGSRPALR